jgi:hypothetical protein
MRLRLPLRTVLPALLCAAPAFAGPVAGVEPLYPAAPAAWAGAIGAELAAAPGQAALTPALAALAAPSVAPAAAYAPVVAQLKGALGLTPAVFAALPGTERRASLELAADSAREELAKKTYQLEGEAHALAAPGRTLDKAGRAELYAVVARLDEVRTRYGAYLDEGSRRGVESAYALAAGRAWRIRGEILKGSIRGPAADFAAAAGPSAASARAPPAALPPGSPAAVKLLERMRATKSGWGADDIDALLTGFGFVRREGGKHVIYTSPDFPQLHETVSRQRDLPPGYVQTAIRDVEELGRLRAGARPAAPADAAAAPPAEIRLADLAVLLPAPETGKQRAAPKAAASRPDARRAAAERTEEAAPAPASTAASAPLRRPPAAERLLPAAPRPAPAPDAAPAPPAPARPERKPGTLRRLSAWLRARGL